MTTSKVPVFRFFSPTARVQTFLADWRAELSRAVPQDVQEKTLYEKAWIAYQEGDYGFGLWCWQECDRLAISLGGVRGVGRLVGTERYLGFSHRKAIAAIVPLDRVYRQRKGDPSMPRPAAIHLADYQFLCVIALRAHRGDAKAKAELTIALDAQQEKTRVDPYFAAFETFRSLLERTLA